MAVLGARHSRRTGRVAGTAGDSRECRLCAFPTHRGAPVQYRKLDFARQTDWASLVETVLEAGQ